MFISAIHAYEGCVEHGLSTSEKDTGYLVGPGKPPIPCGGVQLLFIGKGALVTESTLDPSLNLDRVIAKKRILGCFDCVPVAEGADIVVGRVVDPSILPSKPQAIELAESEPHSQDLVVLVGKPESPPSPFPRNETRVTMGKNFQNGIAAKQNFKTKAIRGL